MNYFEQFAGDELIDYAQTETRLVYMPTGEYIAFDMADSYYKQAQKLWEKIGSPSVMLRSFVADTAIEVWAYGQLLSRAKQ